jgi:hypothetical protein
MGNPITLRAANPQERQPRFGERKSSQIRDNGLLEAIILRKGIAQDGTEEKL